MKNTIKSGIAMALATLIITGCASRKPKVVINPYPAQAVVQVIPPQGRPEPKVAPVTDRSLPVYSNPTIEQVEMAPYVNDEGNLVFPGKMLVIRSPGHWNVEAARRDSQYFIPADNMPPKLAPPSKSYYDYIQSKRDGALPTTELDVSSVHVTGFTQREEEDQAKATLKSGEALSFDPFLGWIAVPTQLLQTGGNLNPKPTRPPAMQPKLQPPQKAPEAPTQQVTPGSGNLPVPQSTQDDIPTSSRDQEVKKIIEDAFKNPGKSSTTSTNQ